MSILIVGSINIDLTAYSTMLPRPGETVHAQRYRISLGGKGANQAVAVARLGGDATMVGRVGGDAFAETALDALRSFGVRDEEILRYADASTGIALINVDEGGENFITVVGGANMMTDQALPDRVTDLTKSAEVLLLQLEIPFQQALEVARAAHDHETLVVLDPAPAPRDGLDPDIFRWIDCITPNETETEILTGIRPTSLEEAKTAAAALLARGIKFAIIKMGGSGVYFASSDEAGFMPPFKVKSVDNVAAGDSFNGGLAYALGQKRSLADAVRFAAACGALATTRHGAADSAPTLSEVSALLNSGGENT